MAETHFIYIVCIPPSLKVGDHYKSVLETSEWKKQTLELIASRSTLTIYSKESKTNGHTQRISFYVYPILKAFMVHITLETWYKEADIENDKIVEGLLNKCKLHLYSYEKYIFKICKGDIELNNERSIFQNRFLFSEIVDTNEICNVDLSLFLLRTDFEEPMNTLIRRNIFHILWISRIANNVQHFWEKITEVEKNKILRTFWGLKFFVDTCPASKKFSLFTKYYSQPLNNLLRYHEMMMYEAQNKMLKKIHFVESGLLILTFAIIFDIIYNIVHELTSSVELSLIVAFFALSVVILLFKNPIKEMIINFVTKSTEDSS